MSSPDHGRGPEGGPAAPTVSTAPAAAGTTAPDVAPGHRWWSAIPRHLGRARTSTVVLGLLFVGLFALYLTVRPPAEGAPATPDPTSDPAVVEEPTPTAETTPPAPTTTGPTDPVDEAPGTTPAQPTGERAEPTRQTEQADPEETADEPARTTSPLETGEPSQPTATPTG